MNLIRRIIIVSAAAAMFAPAVSGMMHAAASGISASEEMLLTQTSVTVPYACSYVYEKIIAMKSQYPDGTAFSNANTYSWKGGYFTSAGGCAAFAFMLSDAAFGSLPASMSATFDAEKVRVGDILRWNGHSLIVLEVRQNSIIAAEGNVNQRVVWGREFTFDTIEASSFEHYITRYPEGFAFTGESLSLDSGSSASMDVISRDALSLTWTSSNPAVASVDANGNVTAHGGGEAVITASFGTVSDSFTVTVTGAAPPVSENQGDVNQDGAVEISDASDVLSVYASQAAGLSVNAYTEAQLTAADVNSDSAVNLTDASAILSYYAQNAAGLNPSWNTILS
ncbi:MAG: Ig-like domain-containing protein [Ruminococcus sp.]|nr:Ig-like domain-containing protein [Ruminococcus sp.]